MLEFIVKSKYNIIVFNNQDDIEFDLKQEIYFEPTKLKNDIYQLNIGLKDNEIINDKLMDIENELRQLDSIEDIYVGNKDFVSSLRKAKNGFPLLKCKLTKKTKYSDNISLDTLNKGDKVYMKLCVKNIYVNRNTYGLNVEVIKLCRII